MTIMNIENLIKTEFRGCISVTQENTPLFLKAYGYADLPNKVPNDAETKFATASAGKVFVAVAILQLIEAKKLSFNDKIGDLLDFDLKAIDQNITIEELLTHTSGMPDYFDESIMNEYEDLWIDFPNYKIRSNQDLLPLFINKPMMYERKSKFQYNNAGYVLLALIIEKITGAAFDQYLKEKIFIPCGMTCTGYYELDCLPPKCAYHYIFDTDRNGYRTNIFSVDAKGTGAGGAFTTVKDIQLFWQGLLSYQLLSQTMIKSMMTNHSGEADCYGYGIWLKKQGSHYLPYFQGSDPGVSFISSCDKEKKTVITLISNYGDNVWNLHKAIVLALK
nr:serine hydrolase domain-containing protein [Beduini massiliensis]